MGIGEFLFWMLFGALLATVLMWLGRQGNIHQERTVWGGALLVTALWYLGFALIANQGINVLWPQILAGGFFAFCAYRGTRDSFLYLSIGWFIHIIWDNISFLVLGAEYAPHLTLPACISFDIISGTYLFLRYLDLFPTRKERKSGI